MNRLATLVALSLVVLGCGSKKPAQAPDAVGEGEVAPDSSGSGEGKTKGEKSEKGEKTGEKAGGGEDDAKPKTSICTGFELDLLAALGHSSCEVADKKPTDVKQVDLKKVLDIKLMTSANKVEPGGHVDVIIQFTNKGKEPLTLDFLLDPTPRFQVETYDAKSAKRMDLPAAKQPVVPSNIDRPESPQTLGRVTIVPNGSAHAKVGWDAVKTKWAPEKLKGTPPEMGFPRVPAGPLPKGRYMIRVVTPLLNAQEGMEHEVSAPRVAIEVGK